MGQKLLSIYEDIKKAEGLRGQMRLAMLTNIPSANAKDAPDSPETMAKFAAAYKEITQKECPIK
ncbi:MAG: hypothetical protein FWG14_05365 [Peptococcaceae bacterium]|nr:hypothetical protein [Peptococcaceae bacterium]